MCFVLSFLLFVRSFGRKHSCLHTKSRSKDVKVLSSRINQSGSAESGGNWTHFPSIYSLIGRVVSMYRPKMDGPNLSEMDIKVLLPAPTFCLQAEQSIFHNWKDYIIPWSGKMKTFSKLKKQVCKTKNKCEGKIFMVSHVQFIFPSLSSICPQKWGEISGNTSWLFV